MPTLNIKGLGKVKTTKQLPKSLKKGSMSNIKRQNARFIFAANNLAKGERARLLKKLG